MVPVLGDGSCFFHSMAEVLGQLDPTVKQKLRDRGLRKIDTQFLRNIAVDFIENN